MCVCECVSFGAAQISWPKKFQSNGTAKGK